MEAYEGRLCARHPPDGQGGDVPPSPPGGQPRPDHRPGPLQVEARGRRPLSRRLGGGGRYDPGAGRVPPCERRRAGRRPDALPAGVRPGARIAAGDQRPRRGGRARHCIRAHRRPRRNVPGRGRVRIGPAERGPRIPERPYRRCRREVSRVRCRQDVRGSRCIQGPGRRRGLPRAPRHRSASRLLGREGRDAPFRPARDGRSRLDEQARAH